MGSFTVYKSSAGSGKTYTLVREYLLLALFGNSRKLDPGEVFFPDYFRHILAITFTNKAAAEMKERILTALMQLSYPEQFSGSGSIRFMLPELTRLATCSDEEVTLRAKKVLKSLLHDYDNFAISTIDSFVTRIIQTFAHDLHLPADFRIELDTQALLQPAVDRLISKVGSNRDLTDLLSKFAETKAEDEKNWNIENDILQVSQHLFTEDGYPFVRKLNETTSEQVIYIAGFIRRFCKEFELQLAETAGEAVRICEESGIRPDDFFQSSKGIGAYFYKIAKGNWENPKPNSYVRKTANENNWYSRTQDKRIASLIDRHTGCLLEVYQNIQAQIDAQYPDYVLLKLVEKNIYQIGVLSAVEQEVEQLKQEQNVLHISEFNRRITEIIQSEPAPFIYERIGEKYHHYLLDEFQDTSELQWKNLLPLLNNALATRQFNLIVGDGKQAIYRWRNGQVDQFVSLPEIPESYDAEVFGEAEHALVANYEEKHLESNFRSLPAVIDFNNRFFDFAPQELLSEAWQKIYERHAQKTAPEKSGGLVSVCFLDGKTKSEYQAAVLTQLEKTIRQVLDDGYRLNDIAILTRTNKEGSLAAQYFSGKGIGVMSPDSLMLSESPEINLLVSAMQWLVKPDDRIAATAVVNFFADINQFLPEKRRELFSKIAAQTKLEKILQEEGCRISGTYLQTLTLYDLCEELIRIFRLDVRPNPYIQSFLDFVNNQQVDNISQLAQLLDVWEKKKYKLCLSVPDGIDALNLMTIHKAKGLEFPVVVWAFASENLKPTKTHLWEELDNPLLQGLPVALLRVNKDFAEAGFGEDYADEQEKSKLDLLNLMYVAMTRPVERLYILSKDTDLAKKAKDETVAVSMHELLKKFILSQSDWMGVGEEHIFGQAAPPLSAGHQPQEHALKLEKSISTNWRQQVFIAAKSLQNEKNPEISEQRRKWGNLIHAALSQIKTFEDREAVFQQMVLNGQLSEDQKKEFATQIQAVMEHPALKTYFQRSSDFLAEAEIISPSAGVLRPDRIIWDGPEATILEFKTGSAKEQHKIQLEQYALLLEQMKYKVVKKLLVYIDEKVTVVEI